MNAQQGLFAKRAAVKEAKEELQEAKAAEKKAVADARAATSKRQKAAKKHKQTIVQVKAHTRRMPGRSK